MDKIQLEKKFDINGWRNDIIGRGNVILDGLRPDEKFDLVRMSLEMLKMQMQNDRRFSNGLDAPCSYLWESHLSILGIMVSMIFPSKFEDFQNTLNGNNGNKNSSNSNPNSFSKKILDIMSELETQNSEIEREEIIRQAFHQGIDEFKVKEILEKLISNGLVYSPKPGKIKILH